MCGRACVCAAKQQHTHTHTPFIALVINNKNVFQILFYSSWRWIFWHVKKSDSFAQLSNQLWILHSITCKTALLEMLNVYCPIDLQQCDRYLVSFLFFVKSNSLKRDSNWRSVNLVKHFFKDYFNINSDYSDHTNVTLNETPPNKEKLFFHWGWLGISCS